MKPGKTPLEVIELVANGDPGRNGAQDRTATVVATVWGNVSPQSTSEALEAGKQQSSTTHRIELRAHPSDPNLINPQRQLRIKGTTRVFDVVGVTNVDERNRTLLVEAIEQT